MMDLRVSVVLFIFLTGGYSLRCYTCHSDSMGHCNANEKTCSDGFSKCETRTAEICTTDGVYKGSFLLLFSPLLFYFLFQ
ncbi:uncharacterized protein LOC125256827 isoform X2 [Megalobrama amblycephala]|uniref:uncharacterized protein LOC125256827 isoform X2 n=1 Tax=Megalobrama amblycephala TaxID=75352 RepID=UPI0020141238|nr:uncharacterized protein LOC125256827 isoform X2 [Megalobrama amblycephala]